MMGKNKERLLSNNKRRMTSLMVFIAIMLAMIPMFIFGAGTEQTPEDDSYRIVALNGYNIHFGLYEVLIGQSMESDPYGKATPGYAFVGDTYNYQLKIDGVKQESGVTWEVNQSTTGVVTNVQYNNILTFTAAKSGTVTIYAKVGGIKVRKATITIKSNFASGNCGPGGSSSVKWTLDKNRKLTITGTGDMDNYDREYLPPWYEQRKNILEVEVKSGVTRIGNYSFYNFDRLNKLTVASSVKYLGKYSFYSCDGLKSAKFPGIISIGSHTFYDCYSLRYVYIPDTVNYMGRYAFAWCDSITNFTVPSSLKTIKGYTFYGCGNLQKIVVPSGVEHIGDYVFARCNKLSDVSLDKYSVGTMGRNVFYRCKNLTSFVMPDYVATPGRAMFEGCTMLESVVLSSRVQNIQSNTFDECTNLKSINIPNSVQRIGSYAFYNCKTLESVNFGNSVEYIDNRAFYNCRNIQNIKLPDSLLTIGTSAFSNCRNLKDITFGTGLNIINSDAFYYCTSLKELDFNDNLSYIGSYAFEQCYSLEDIHFGNGLQTIGNSAFYNCSNIKELEFNDNLSQINYGAFNNCYSLEKIKFGAGTTYNSSIFNNYNNIKYIILNDTLESISSYEFNNLDNLEQIYIPKNTVINHRVRWDSQKEEYYNDYYQIMPHNPNLKIKGYLSSDARRYADQYNITFIPIDGEKTNLSACAVETIPDYQETGKAINPSVKITDQNGWKLQKGLDYTVSYSNNINPGTAVITISGIGNYFGNKTINFTITEKPQEPDPPGGGGGTTTGGGGGGSISGAGDGDLEGDGDKIIKIDVPQSSITGNNGNISMEIDPKSITEHIGKNTTGVQITAKSDTEKVKSSSVTIPAEAINKISDAGANLQLSTPNGDISLDKKSLNAINNSSNYDSIVINIENIKDASLYDIYEITILYNGRKKITSFNKGKLNISLNAPEKLNVNKGVMILNKNGIYYYDMKSKLNLLNKTSSFETNHLSTYLIAGNSLANRKLISSINKSKTKSLVVKASNGRVKLSWRNGTGNKPNTFAVYRSLKKNGGYKLIKKVRNGERRYTDNSKLKKGKKYYYKVAGIFRINRKNVFTKPTPIKSVTIK